MRIRRKPWARPELAECPFFISEPKMLRGRWQSAFEAQQPLYLELGCGKGSFIAQTACQNPHINYIAIDIKSEMLVLAKRNIENAYAAAGIPPSNIRILSQEITRISELLAPTDRVDGIYINFSNPWPKMKHQKRRLTHPRQLMQYRSFLRGGGKISFKTDDRALYEDTIEYFSSCGFSVLSGCRDLYAAGVPQGSNLTEHEQMFLHAARPIYFAEAIKISVSD